MENIPRLYTVLSEMMACWVYLQLLCDKGSARRVLLSTLGFVLAERLYAFVNIHFPIWLWPLNMLFLFGLLFGYIWSATGRSPLTAFYCTVKAFLTAELIASLEWQIAYFYQLHVILSPTLQLVVALIFYLLCLLFVWVIETYLVRDFPARTLSIQECILAGLIVLVVFLLSNLGFFVDNTIFSSGDFMGLFVTRTLFDACGIALLFAFQSKISEVEARLDIDRMNRDLATQYQRYQNYQDDIALINMKYHDLRHQMEALKGALTSQTQTVLLHSIESELQAYSPQFETGHEVINALLDSRYVLCTRQGISITAVVDGTLLRFISNADLCALFGNALDNAIESASAMTDPDHRLIHLEVVAQRGFCCILIENSCGTAVDMKNGIPQTRKPDRANHGYGMRSIQNIVAAYKGTMVIEATQDWFSLKILFPLSST